MKKHVETFERCFLKDAGWTLSIFSETPALWINGARDDMNNAGSQQKGGAAR